MPKISEERKAATRRRLVDAAVEVILTSGPGAATTRQILETAGLSAGALYHYFSSKDDLYDAIAERFGHSDDDFFALPPDADARAVAKRHVAMVEALFTPGPNRILGQLRAASLANQTITAALERFDELVVARESAINRRSRELGLFTDDVDDEALVEVIETFLEGFGNRDASGAFVTGRERVLRMFLEMLAARVIDDSHPDAGELRDRLLAVSGR